ncbi:MAG: hypothetical protein AAB437_03455 [Patescibacteria group bacterium]
MSEIKNYENLWEKDKKRQHLENDRDYFFDIIDTVVICADVYKIKHVT